MKLAAILLSTLAGGALLLASDRVRDVQSELKTQGFYFGEVDGKDGPETIAALRRYQIRNGLKVTGKLDAETIAALGMTEQPTPGDATDPKAKPIPMESPGKKPSEPQFNPAPVEKEAPGRTARPRQDLLRETEEGEDYNPAPQYPDDPNVVAPPSRIPSAVDNEEYETFFHGTPYASAPLEVQVDIVRKAQAQLARMGLFKGGISGLPATLTSEALFDYQARKRLARTGRLDMQTLAAMDLLPGRGPDAPPVRPFTDPNRRRDRSVDYRGMIR